MIDAHKSRFTAEGRFVVDRRPHGDEARICECFAPEYAARIAQALSLMGQLEEAYTSDHDAMLYEALAALKRTKSSVS